MPTNIGLEDLIALNDEIRKVKKHFPEACSAIVELLKKRRNLGYKNFCRLFTGEWTPESLKTGSNRNNKED